MIEVKACLLHPIPYTVLVGTDPGFRCSAVRCVKCQKQQGGEAAHCRTTPARERMFVSVKSAQEAAQLRIISCRTTQPCSRHLTVTPVCVVRRKKLEAHSCTEYLCITL